MHAFSYLTEVCLSFFFQSLLLIGFIIHVHTQGWFEFEMHCSISDPLGGFCLRSYIKNVPP